MLVILTEGDLVPRNADQFPVRMPPGMRDRIKAAAAANHRSMNSEIVSILERVFPAPEMTAGAKASETSPAVIEQNAARQGGLPITKDERTVSDEYAR